MALPSSNPATSTDMEPAPSKQTNRDPILSPIIDGGEDEYISSDDTKALERRLRLKVDLRLCTIATAFIHTWKEMIALRVLLGVAMSGIYPGLTYLISTWYPRREQQTRFAFLQSGECIILATGSIINASLNQLDGRGGLAGWRYMFLVQGLISLVLGLVTYFWIVDFPEHAHRSLWFLTESEQRLACTRINDDRQDVEIDSFSWKKVLIHAKDAKVYGFACMFFLLNLVSTSLSYFLPIILQNGMGFDANKAILLSALPYYWAVIPVLASSIFGDKLHLRGPVIVFNCICLITGFSMLGFTEQVTVRYIGTFLASGAYISNWAALSAYQAGNITGQHKRIFTAALVTMFNGAGGIAGSFIVRSNEAPRYMTAIWVSIGSHVLIILLVAGFSAYFYVANNAARSGKRILEGVEGFRLVGIFRNNYHDNEGDDNGQSDLGAVVILLEALIMTYLGQFLDGRSSEHHPTCSFELSRTLRQGLDLPNFSLQSLNSAWSVQQADINYIFSLPAAFEEAFGELFRYDKCYRYIFHTGVPRTDHLERFLAIEDRACIGCGMIQADGAKEWRYASAAQRGDEMRCSRCHYAANRPINVRVTGRLMAIEDRVYIDCGKTQATSVMCWYAEFSRIDQLGTTDLVNTTLFPKHNRMTK
ncbi:putative MFS transporter [Seiridium unicorne]|uniref:MFS transporter n=1 Tax=Seiridium unicorne TaxID=138068 RepID=A0ABR2VEY2_9PEZI